MSTATPVRWWNGNPQECFRTAAIGDYFYLTFKNKGIYLLGQFSGPANVFCSRRKGWLDRPFRYIRPATEIRKYSGTKSGGHPITFHLCSRTRQRTPMFEDLILLPHFGLDLG